MAVARGSQEFRQIHCGFLVTYGRDYARIRHIIKAEMDKAGDF
jgi:hypothetical protein